GPGRRDRPRSPRPAPCLLETAPQTPPIRRASRRKTQPPLHQRVVRSLRLRLTQPDKDCPARGEAVQQQWSQSLQIGNRGKRLLRRNGTKKGAAVAGGSK